LIPTELHSRSLAGEPLREEIRALWEAIMEAEEAETDGVFCK
jgi:hypothetical protein